MKILINRCYGGFGLSVTAHKRLNVFTRTNPEVIKVVEELGSQVASGECADLRVVEIPDNATDWEIREYDGLEEVVCVVDGKIVHITE